MNKELTFNPIGGNETAFFQSDPWVLKSLNLDIFIKTMFDQRNQVRITKHEYFLTTMCK